MFIIVSFTFWKKLECNFYNITKILIKEDYLGIIGKELKRKAKKLKALLFRNIILVKFLGLLWGRRQ